MNETLSFEHTEVRIFSFQQGGVDEFHVMVRVNDSLLSFQEQLDAVLDAYQHLIGGKL